MLKIEVLGSGCANCRKLEAVARAAAQAAGVQAEFVKVSDHAAILAYDVTTTPALVIDGKLRCSGRIPTRAEVGAWLAER